MATAETASASLGLSYAPEDPTLPKPWTGLIDGSTGLLYYWNPETNLTQYEKPVSLAPPVAAPPLPATAPKLAPIPSARSIPQNGTVSQLPPQQQPQQYPGYQMQQQPMSHQMLNQPSQPMPNQMGHHYPQPHMNQMAHPPASYMPGPQGHQQQGQPMPSPQGHPQQHGWKSGFPSDGEPGGREESQVAFQAPHAQQQPSVASSGDRFPGSAPQIPHAGGYSVHPRPQIGGPPSVSMQHSGAGLNQLPQAYAGQPHQQRPLGGPPLSNQVGNTIVCPVMEQKMGYGEDQHESAVNEYYSSSRKEGPPMFPQQPRHEAIPYDRNQQGIRMDVANTKSAAPGYPDVSNVAAEIVMPSIHGRTGFPTVAPLGSSPRIFSSSDTSNISTTDAYRQHHEVTAMGDNIPAPFMTFEATGFPAEILREMHSAGFYSPTPIQAQTWPLALQSRDIVAIAKTGSGKTLGYLIPAFLHLKQCRNNPQIGPTILVLSPTRELATQIQVEAIKFGRSSRISCTCLYGGAPKGPQLKEIERGADIIVATPGRLNDILEMKRINFSQVSFLVLDEADRMLDMGFEPQIRTIVNAIPPRRQTLMYTATWPKEVRKIAGDLLVNPVQVNIGSVDELAANKSITQYVELVPPMEKQRRLEQILRTLQPGSKIIIFCSTKKLCDQLARSIGRTFGAAAIHGDKSQGERDHVLNQFRHGRAPILVATDVAARGLDIKDIRIVVNYDFPTGIEDYVHRIGRTGRAGATGISYTFISDQDWKHAADLVKVLEGANQHVPPEVREMAARGGGSTFSRGRGGMSRVDSGSSRWDSGGGRGMRDASVAGGRWDSGDRGMRDGSRRWDSGGGRGMRDGSNGFGVRGGRSDFIAGGRGNRGRGFGRFDRGPQDRGNNTYGRGRYDGRMGLSERNRDHSRSPERVRTYDGSRSRSWSRSRSRSWSRSPSRSRSRSRSEDRPERSRARAPSGFDVPPPGHVPAMPLGGGNGTLPKEEPVVQFPQIDDAGGVAVAGAVPGNEVVDL